MNPYESWPKPPVEALMPETPQMVLTVGISIAAAAFVIYALVILVREKDAFPIVAMIGGTVAALGEPISDLLGSCWYPVHGQWVGIDTFRTVPLFVIPGYMCQFGATTFMLVRWFKSGITEKQLWVFCLMAAISQLLLEVIGIHYGLWVYYGAQPFMFMNYPLWWVPADAASFLVPGVLLYVLRPYLTGIRMLAVIPLVLCGHVVGQSFTSWPIWTALHSAYGYAATYPAGLLTVALSFLLVHLLAKIVVDDSELAKFLRARS